MPDASSLRVRFRALDNASPGEAGLLPLLPLTLAYRERSVELSGLVDTGATVNVMPYSLGLALGAEWNDTPATLKLTGNLAQFMARPLLVFATVGEFSPVQLAFAWTQAEKTFHNVPLLLGQINFFLEFDVCFYRSRQQFDVQPKQAPLSGKE